MRPGTPSEPASRPRPASFSDIFAVGEFRALFAAAQLSTVGDQLARVAIAVLVYQRTGSPALTTLTYALTFLPDLIGGPLLSGIADRYPRRTVMVVCDLARVPLVALMTVPGAPLVVIFTLLVAVQLLNAPFAAARAATLPTVLRGDSYLLGSAVSNVTVQLAQLSGFAVGGVLVAAIGTGPALLADAGTFLFSAALISLGVRARPAPSGPVAARSWTQTIRSGTRVVWRDRRLRVLVALACVSGCYITAEGLAVPYADRIGGGPIAAGLLLAAAPAGTAFGMIALARWVAPATRLRWMGPMAVAACAPLIACAWHPGLSVTVALLVASGTASAYHLAANAEFVRSVPDEHRGQAFGLATTALRLSQGAGLGLAGVAAEAWGPGPSIAAFGLIGVLVAGAAGASWRRVSGQHTPEDPR